MEAQTALMSASFWDESSLRGQGSGDEPEPHESEHLKQMMEWQTYDLEDFCAFISQAIFMAENL